jgi:ABC-type Fe3+-siderophore transport system permease subunit
MSTRHPVFRLLFVVALVALVAFPMSVRAKSPLEGLGQEDVERIMGDLRLAQAKREIDHILLELKLVRAQFAVLAGMFEAASGCHELSEVPEAKLEEFIMADMTMKGPKK